jgi:hypothetical protein
MTAYIGWNGFGAIAPVVKEQGITVVLNQFFGPLVAAARSLALSIDSAACIFSVNFFLAVSPQIIKRHATANNDDMIRFLFFVSKITHFLMYIVGLPIILELPGILQLWLGYVPEYTVVFSRLALINVILNNISHPLGTAARASGKVRLYNTALSGISLLNFPISFVFLLCGLPPYCVMVVLIVMTIITHIVRLIIMPKLIFFPVALYLRQVLLRMGKVTCFSIIWPMLALFLLKENFTRICIITAITIISAASFMWLFGLDKYERNLVKNVISSKLFNKKTLE